MGWMEAIAGTRAVAEIAAQIGRGGAASVRGIVGSSTTLVVAALARANSAAAGKGGPLLYVVAHLDEADEILDELEGLGLDAAKLPAMEILPGETGVNLELLAERLALTRRLVEADPPAVIVAPIQALMQRVPAADRLGESLRAVRAGDTLDSAAFTAWLVDGGYRRVETIESAGEFAVRGGIIDVYPVGGEPTRLDLFGETVEGVFAVDLDSMGSDRRLDALTVVAGREEQFVAEDATLVSFLAHLPAESVAILAEVLELTEQGRSYFDRAVDGRGLMGPPAVFQAIQERCRATIDFNQFSAGSAPARTVELDVEALPTFHETAADAVKELVALAAETPTVVFCQNEGETHRFRELLAEAEGRAQIDVETRYLHRGLVWAGDEDASARTALVPYHELLHRYQTRRRVRKIAAGRAMDAFVDLQVGDHVVHRDHGIAKFVGLRTLKEDAGAEEFLTLEFARGARLNTPATRIELVQKYIGAFSGRPELSTLGGKRWGKQKEKVSEAVRDLAAEMLRLQAAREAMPGIRYPADTPWQREFEAEFPYQETEDQLAAINAFKRDMSSERPMDRLVCGDVGFGKTEVAIRAAFKAVEYGKQVAVLVPTTVLADQHQRTFRQRFADYPFRVETISRFKTRKEQTAILEDVRAGRVDIVIGTHRLLSEDVHFADLGLVVIDEEQRFGVEHKQRLLGFRATADVMTLSATPIPRTLHMAILGLRDISSLSTPPLDRRAIVTEVIPENERRIKQAILRELAREGQVFFLHNRVFNIESVADDVQRLAPDARVIIGHGQMPARALEKIMLTFTRGDADILVSTTIIESGIDIPNANTMIVKDAHRFGLSELHQLRGRVGRYKHRAYCYLMLPREKTVSETAVKRLTALENFSMLGAGFRIALRDLEIRGAGNLLGAEQSGHIATVGYEMYCQLLEAEVRDLKHEKKVDVSDCVIDVGIGGGLPKAYIPADARRMDAYRRVSQADDYDRLDQMRRDLVSAYGELPRRGEILFDLAEIRISAARLGVKTVTRHDDDIIFRTARPKDLEAQMRGAKGTLRTVDPNDPAPLKDVYFRPPPAYLEPDTLLTVLRRRLRPASSVAPAATVAAGPA